jgi:hypothetical protein
MVISIINFFAAIIFPQLNEARDRARFFQVSRELNELANAVEVLHLDTGLYPNEQSSSCEDGAESERELDDCDSGIVCRNPGEFPGWKGPYLYDLYSYSGGYLGQ